MSTRNIYIRRIFNSFPIIPFRCAVAPFFFLFQAGAGSAGICAAYVTQSVHNYCMTSLLLP